MARDTLRTGFTSTITIGVPGEVILRAFFDDESLRGWWRVGRSLCVPRPFGCYAVEWAIGDRPDDTLGRLGGVFHGTVMTFDPQREFFVANAYWMAPDAEPLGPMAFEVACTGSADGTIAHVRLSGSDRNERFSRYYELFGEGIEASLQRLKARLEQPAG